MAERAEPKKEEPCPPPRPSLWRVMPVKVENDLHWRILYDEQEQRTFRTITELIEYLLRALQTQGFGIKESWRIADKLNKDAMASAKADAA